MQNSPPSITPWRSMWIIFGSLLIVGAGLGWMVGLSVSPVVSIVISAVGTLTATVVAAVMGLQDKPKWQITPVPLAILVIGLIFGSTLGIRAREFNLLGKAEVPPPLETPASALALEEAKNWRAAGLPLEEQEIMQRLFDLAYPALPINTSIPTPAASASTSTSAKSEGGVLFAVTLDECRGLLGTPNDAELRRALGRASYRPLQELPGKIDDATVLRWLISEVLCASDS